MAKGTLNKVLLIGRLGKDPEIRHTKDGNAVATFSVATNESWRDKEGNQQERTDWHRIVVFSPGLSEIVEKFLKKGSKVYIEGQLRTRKYTDQAGVEKNTTEVVLQSPARIFGFTERAKSIAFIKLSLAFLQARFGEYSALR